MPWDTDSYSSSLLDAADKIKTLEKQIMYWADFASREIKKAEIERDKAIKYSKALEDRIEMLKSNI